MAQVPTATNSLPSVEPRPFVPTYQSAEAPAAAFGSLQAQSEIEGGKQLQAASNSATDIALSKLKEDNDRAVKQADVTLQTQIRNIVYGDGTQTNPGYYSQRGETALSNEKSTREAIEKARKDVVAGMAGSPRLQQTFDLHSQTVAGEEAARISRFVETNRRFANDQTGAARETNAINDAVASWNDPKVAQRSLATIASEALDFGHRNGLGPDAIAAREADNRGKLYSGVIEAAARADSKAGVALFNQYKNDIPGTALPGIERDLRTAINMERSQKEHDDNMRRRQLDDSANAARDKYVTALIDPDRGTIDLKAMATDPALSWKPEYKEEVRRLAMAVAKGEPPATVSRKTWGDLYSRMLLPDGDFRRLTDESEINLAMAEGKLGRTDGDWLRNELKSQRTPEGTVLGQRKADFYKAATGVIQGVTIAGIPDPEKSMNVFYYQQFVEQKIADAIRNKQDPYELITPGNPKFLGSPAIVSQYQRPLDVIVKDSVDRMRSPGTAVNSAITTATKDYGSVEELQSDYAAKKIGKDAARRIAREKGWAQ